jgi:uncharacterized damage-inducible protein DinB/GNAT superfamily N-acetyltransferase
MDIPRHDAATQPQGRQPNVPTVHVRALASRDSLAAMTQMLNRAYAPLLARGLNFTASTQDVETTRRRAAEGQCFVADLDGVVVGTITACGPYDEREVDNGVEMPWYRDIDIAHLQQFGVDPAYQGQGVGRRLMAAGERWAQERGFGSVALDTAEPAHELVATYQRMGYTTVGTLQWPGKSYRSLVMRKCLGQSALREQLKTLARYNQWATQRLFAAVDLLPDEAYRRDVGLFFKSVHGTLNHLLLASHELWLQRFGGGSTTLTRLDLEIEPDRRALQRRLLADAADWLAWLDGVTEQQLLGELAYRRTDGQAFTLPFAATLAHVFNHGTHHRGQVTAALTMLGQPCPELDLVRMLQEERPTR